MVTNTPPTASRSVKQLAERCIPLHAMQLAAHLRGAHGAKARDISTGTALAPPGRVKTQAAAIAMAAATVASAALLVPAMCVYPGGTQWDRTAEGNDFWRTYLCDLARTVALNGRPNPLGSALAQGSMLVLALGLFFFFWVLPRMVTTRARLGPWIRLLGTLAVIATVFVVLLPANRFSGVHGAAIVAAGVPGLIAASLAVIGLARQGSRALAVVGATTLLVSLGAFVIYLRQFLVAGPGPVAGAVLERVALLALFGWIAAVARRAGGVYKHTSG
jgi:hypothetical protein